MHKLFSGSWPSLAIVVAAASASTPAQASAPSIGVAAPTIAETATDDAATPPIDAFRLIEHGGWMPVVRASPVEQDPTPSRLTTVRFGSQRAIRSGRRSSAARDRVILQIHAAERRHGLPFGLLDALVAAESGYRADAVSGAGAAGLGQLMPATARSLGVVDRFDIRANLDGAARYLRSMIDKFGSISKALAAYNAGPGAVIRAGGIPRNRETPTYVYRVLGLWRGRSF